MHGALGAQGYFSTQHFINLSGTFLVQKHTCTHTHKKIGSALHESLDLLRQVTNKVKPVGPIKKSVCTIVAVGESVSASNVTGSGLHSHSPLLSPGGW